MAFLRSVGGDPGPAIRGRRIYLRQPQLGDFPQWASLREASRAFLVPWEPTWPADDLTRGAFRRRIRRYAQDVRDDTAYPFYAFRLDDDALLGGLTLSNVRRGVTQSCSLGYWAGAQHAGRGYMSEAVVAVLPYVFEHLRLHRIEAACLPTNAASIRLLEKVGFVREGYARRYLRINGSWQDHFLFAMLHDDPRPVIR
ncbi:GNAT family N-acetyltransferase [Lutibaculum baratangense]|uniref:Ribosomal-protein-S5p-alanine acetyltransferase n=1 Tax=Lutibaculum baratangense AMV1 TaxID=631454 RepID=V4RP29_9HYPH|nr:GNAT family protein [Lutibaculum baratangense]ESR24930.1 Ribosomal-protein-S5p-alanine acetyltransferase [Lutibaculum baratangense AMV1]